MVGGDGFEPPTYWM